MNISSTSPVLTGSAAKNAVAEAKETAAQTQAEAARGDQQAIRKLAQQEAAKGSVKAEDVTPTQSAVKDLFTAKA